MLTRRHGPAHFIIVTAFIASLAIVPAELRAASSQNFAVDPYSLQIREQIEKLNSSQTNVRAAAAEALGFLRAYRAADALVESLNDNSAKVRREA
ncbi:MAG: HEAT repeat domain-containing protein, partial [Planctomycetota bacterium]